MKSKNENKEGKWGYVCGGEKRKEEMYRWKKKMKREGKIR